MLSLFSLTTTLSQKARAVVRLKLLTWAERALTTLPSDAGTSDTWTRSSHYLLFVAVTKRHTKSNLGKRESGLTVPEEEPITAGEAWQRAAGARSREITSSIANPKQRE